MFYHLSWVVLLFNIINLLYLAIIAGKEQRKHHRDTDPVRHRTSHLCFHDHCKGGPSACMMGNS